MVTLSGEHIYLRALEPEDLDVVFQIENTEDLWELSNTQTPYSRFLIKEYLENAHKDIYEVKQLRLVICEKQSEDVLGLIDLFDFDPKNRRVGVGILIVNPHDRGKGIGQEALDLLVKYAFKHLQVNQLYCNISEGNEASIKLFENQGFVCSGNKKAWNYNNGVYTNELFYQLVKDVY